MSNIIFIFECYVGPPKREYTKHNESCLAYPHVLSVKSGNCYCIDVLDEADTAFITDI